MSMRRPCVLAATVFNPLHLVSCENVILELWQPSRGHEGEIGQKMAE